MRQLHGSILLQFDNYLADEMVRAVFTVFQRNEIPPIEITFSFLSVIRSSVVLMEDSGHSISQFRIFSCLQYTLNRKETVERGVGEFDTHKTLHIRRRE